MSEQKKDETPGNEAKTDDGEGKVEADAGDRGGLDAKGPIDEEGPREDEPAREARARAGRKSGADPKSSADRKADSDSKDKTRKKSTGDTPRAGSKRGRRAAKQAPPEETRWERTKANIKTIGGAVLLAIIIRIGLFEAFEIEGPSMEPTLLNGDRVVVAKFSYGLFLPFASDAVLTWGEPEPGEVVIVKSPHDDIDIVKRVIGVPGDTIEIRDDHVIRNGEPIPMEELGPCEPEPGRSNGGGTECVQETLLTQDYRTSHDLASPFSNHSPTTVPDDHIYILGDHRDRSNDSRFFGVVPISRVKGHAMVIYWSSGSSVRWDRIFDTVD